MPRDTEDTSYHAPNSAPFTFGPSFKPQPKSNCSPTKIFLAIFSGALLGIWLGQRFGHLLS